MNKSRRAIISIVVVALVVVSIGYYEYSSYEQAVLQTTVDTGKITNIVSNAGGGGLALPGSKATTGGGASIVTLSLNFTSFTQLVACSPLKGYSIGQTVKVADQTLRSGQHAYVPDIACPGSESPFRALNLPQTSTSTTTTTA